MIEKTEWGEGMNWEDYMSLALEQAALAAGHGDVPVGALVVRDSDGAILGRGRNRRELEKDATAHAELLAIREACRTLGTWRLTGCTLFVTLEPCPMCTGAVLQSRIGRVVFGAFDEKAGCCGSLTALTEEDFECHPAIYGGVLEGECRRVLAGFFRARREKSAN